MYCITQVQVGVLDIDLCGPSIPKMLNLEGSNIHQCSTGCAKLGAAIEQSDWSV